MSRVNLAMLATSLLLFLPLLTSGRFMVGEEPLPARRLDEEVKLEEEDESLDCASKVSHEFTKAVILHHDDHPSTAEVEEDGGVDQGGEGGSPADRMDHLCGAIHQGLEDLSSCPDGPSKEKRLNALNMLKRNICRAWSPSPCSPDISTSPPSSTTSTTTSATVNKACLMELKASVRSDIAQVDRNGGDRCPILLEAWKAARSCPVDSYPIYHAGQEIDRSTASMELAGMIIGCNQSAKCPIIVWHTFEMDESKSCRKAEVAYNYLTHCLDGDVKMAVREDLWKQAVTLCNLAD